MELHNNAGKKLPAYGNGKVGKFLEVVVIELDPRFKDRIEGIDNLINIVVKVLYHASNAKSPKARNSRAK